VGAVATQSFVDSRYGPTGLDLMNHGCTAEEVLKALVSADEGWPAMAEAYEQAASDLTTGLVAALDAAQSAGGDICGKQSGAVLAPGLPAIRYAQHEKWADLAPRLPEAGLLERDDLAQCLVEAMQSEDGRISLLAYAPPPERSGRQGRALRSD